jgi:hypothetical protein
MQSSPDKMTNPNKLPLILSPTQKSFPHCHIVRTIYPQFTNVNNFIFICSACIFIHMDVTVDTLSYDLTQMDEDKIRIVVSLNEEVELGTLYFEKAKKSFQRKPIGMNAWACVDAKVEGLYIYGGDNITPKDIVGKCQVIISSL